MKPEQFLHMRGFRRVESGEMAGLWFSMRTGQMAAIDMRNDVQLLGNVDKVRRDMAAGLIRPAV